MLIMIISYNKFLAINLVELGDKKRAISVIKKNIYNLLDFYTYNINN